MSKVTEYDAYYYYIAIKLHFESSNYDALKFNFKTSVTPKSFWKRKDKYYFSKMSKLVSSKEELINFYVAHFIKKRNNWIGHIVEEQEVYYEWLKRSQSLSYYLKTDIEMLAEKYEKFDSLFEIKSDKTYPNVIDEYIREDIMIETVSILDQFTGFLNSVKVSDTLVYPDIKKKIQKYSPFIPYNRKKTKDILLNLFTS